MNQKTAFGIGWALCAAISLAAFFGTRAVLEDMREVDSSRSAAVTLLERRLATLERQDSLRLRQLHRLAERETAPTEARDSAAPAPRRPDQAAELPPLPPFNFPGAVICDPSELTIEEREYLEKYPPSANSIVVRGNQGQLGMLNISSKRDGVRTFAQLDDENAGLIEELSTAIIDIEEARQLALADLVGRGAGMETASMAEAFEVGQTLGGYFVLPVGEGFRVFGEDEVECHPRVARVASLLDRIKEDFGEYTSYVVNWVDPSAR